MANAAALQVMSRAFGGTASTAPEGTTDWILGPELRGQWDAPPRRAAVEWMMKAGGDANQWRWFWEGKTTNKRGESYLQLEPKSDMTGIHEMHDSTSIDIMFHDLLFLKVPILADQLARWTGAVAWPGVASSWEPARRTGP